MKLIIDTNVLLVANGQHQSISPKCISTCVELLQQAQKDNIIVIDDGYRALNEYQNKTSTNPAKGVGDVFLKWLLRNNTNPKHCHQVHLNEIAINCYEEFPCTELQDVFDPPDRIYPAIANAHPDKPVIVQAADCKWLDWWPQLQEKGININFICPDDVCRFYAKKFPDSRTPALPNK